MRTVTARDDLPEFKHTECWQLIPGVGLVALPTDSSRSRSSALVLRPCGRPRRVSATSSCCGVRFRSAR